MGNVIWTPEALDDIALIFEHISLDSVTRAGKIVDQIFERLKILLTHPLSGRAVPELPKTE